MKVKELIDALSKMDGDKQVFVTSDSMDWSDDINVAEQTVPIWDFDLHKHVDHENVVVIF